MAEAQHHRQSPVFDDGRPDPDHGGRSERPRSVVPRTRMGGLWVVSVSFAVVLLLLLIFVLQNGRRVEVSFLGAHGQLPLGVALLLAAVFGVLLVALPGTARIVQLRLLDRRHRQPSVPDGPPAAAPQEAPVADQPAGGSHRADPDRAPASPGHRRQG